MLGKTAGGLYWIFCFLERAENTARIIDVKYYTLLPSASFVGSALDNLQWETILRSVSAHRSFRWLNDDKMTSSGVADFLILDPRFPRSLSFCGLHLAMHLNYLGKECGFRMPSHDLSDAHSAMLKRQKIGTVFDVGRQKIITDFINNNNAIGL